MEKLILVDGMSLVFRAYHAMFKSGLRSPDGRPTGAIFGFANLLTSILEKYATQHLAVVFDTEEPTFRHKQYDLYKANRPDFPEDLGQQLYDIKELITLMGIPQFEYPGWEADDIIGTIAKQADKSKYEVYCLTSDKDYYQLVEDNIFIMKPGLKGEDVEIISFDGVAKKFGVRPEQVIDVMALIGDQVDNVPGVKGIGEKTAIPMIQEFGSLENLYNNLDKISKKAVKEKLESNQEMAFLSKQLVTIATEIELSYGADDCKINEPEYSKLDHFFERQGFRTIRIKWAEKAFKSGNLELSLDTIKEPISDIQNIDSIDKDYKLIDNIDDLDNLISYLSDYNKLSFDLETDALDRDICNIVGIALSVKQAEAFYIPTYYANHQEISTGLFDEKKSVLDHNNSLEINIVLNKLKNILESQYIGKLGQNSKFDTYILSRHGIDVSPVVFDTMLASYIINPDEKHNLDDMSIKWLNYKPVSIKSLIGEKKATQRSMSELSPVDVKEYACEDADLAFKLMLVLEKQLVDENLIDLAHKVDFPMVEVLTKMERNGISIDSDTLAVMSVEVKSMAMELTKKIYEEAGMEFNIDSPKQLSHILFEKLQIPPLKSTKTGHSTDVNVLNELASTYPIANMIVEYRQLAKLKSTYIDALPRMVNKVTNRIHTTFNPTVASTGRLSSLDPNLQNIPIRTELGKKIRKAFVCRQPDSILLSADYSQIELRIMAHICGDEKMIQSFKDGLDIHAATAANLYNKKIDDVTSDDRRIAKTVNFGIMYGLGTFGLAQRLGLTRTHASEIIKNYFEKYSGIKKYMDMTIEFTQKHGYAETLLGRRRYFQDINSSNRTLKNAAERGAINMPIQGTAADMMKIAMIAIHKEINNLKLNSKMMLQVHDELVFEVPNNEFEILKNIVIDKMQNALQLGQVPVVVDTGTGLNWLDAH